MPITKNEMVDMLYDQLNISKRNCNSIVESFFDIIKSELEQGNTVKISGFGKWAVRSKKERKGRNPQTGEEMIIDARRVVSFKGSPVLIKTINS